MFIALGILVALFLIGIIVAAIFHTAWQIAEPNEALVISGIKQTDGLGFKIITGGGTVVMPGLQRSRKLSLGLREAQLTTDCVTKQGIPVGIRGVAIFKIGDDNVSIANAARRFLDQPDAVITRNIQNLFDGHLRSIIGGMTVEDLISNRDALTTEARKTAGNDMEKLGLVIDSIQIKDIVDPSGYIQNLAMPHVAEVQKAARIAQALADQEATLREQDALAKKADATRESEILRAGYDAEIAKAESEAAQAGPLAQATARQNVTRAQTLTAQLEADLAEQNLQVSVRRPADAKAYAIKVEAEAERDAAISRAEAEARTIELDAAAKAKAIEITGTAEGLAIEAKLLAEASGIKARGEALASNQDAVISQLLAEKMPEIVSAAASAYSKVSNMMVLDGAKGMSSGLGEIAGTVTTMFPLIRRAVSAIKAAGTVPPPKPEAK